MNCCNEVFNTSIGIWRIQLQFKFSIIRLLTSILPRRSFFTHGYLYALFSEIIHNQETSVFTSLVWVKDLWDSLCILKCHFNCFKCKFFGMHKRYGVSNDFSCIRIKNSCKIQMNSVINNMSKIRSPYNIGSYRRLSQKSHRSMGFFLSLYRTFGLYYGRNEYNDLVIFFISNHV